MSDIIFYDNKNNNKNKMCSQVDNKSTQELFVYYNTKGDVISHKE